MAIARVNGLSLAYETIGDGPPLGHHSRGAVHQGIARACASSPSRWRTRGNRVLDLGPAQLR